MVRFGTASRGCFSCYVLLLLSGVHLTILPIQRLGPRRSSARRLCLALLPFVYFLGPRRSSFFQFFLDIFEPLEGPDTLDVLLDLNDSVHIRTYPNYPGFQHRFVRLYVIFSVDFCSRSTCRHVDLFKTLRSLREFFLSLRSQFLIIFLLIQYSGFCFYFILFLKIFPSIFRSSLYDAFKPLRFFLVILY